MTPSHTKNASRSRSNPAAPSVRVKPSIVKSDATWTSFFGKAHAGALEDLALAIQLFGSVDLEDARLRELGHAKSPRVEPRAQKDELLEPIAHAFTHGVVDVPRAEPNPVSKERER